MRKQEDNALANESVHALHRQETLSLRDSRHRGKNADHISHLLIPTHTSDTRGESEGYERRRKRRRKWKTTATDGKRERATSEDNERTKRKRKQDNNNEGKDNKRRQR